MGLKALIAGLVVTVGFGGIATAHEFWIDPHGYQVAEGDPIVADLRVGQDFQGSVYAYIPANFTRFELVQGDAVAPVEGRAGDRPALNMAAPGDGLAVVVHVTKDYLLTYSEREKFVNFVTHKDFAWALDQHAARGLPEVGFRERYSRHAKALIDVGTGAGQDRVVGLETEILALANPYTDDLSAGFPVQVFYQGQVRADVQVEVFDKAPNGDVTISQYRTDADGKALVPVMAGHSYLVDSVVMRPVDPMGDDLAVWESLWASVTFAVPQ
ncbi:DUF4198 domain-containing protein [Pseudoprimorskyibacter insulae]|uniref:Nickel uptake substrate-specific transmembrane region n=1 Tax=Pseudoprimorskyibacter insulae TaxID=1695997 RepID=A0A2R8APP7_9RHOB|nr:DUF4198 domain-containing protein [Pseudoprimorskyibacter insulae]SPF77867.1 hypothetical protein PRI8871_00454 [Pseudoprimorskyibacter insulae]